MEDLILKIIDEFIFNFFSCISKKYNIDKYKLFMIHKWGETCENLSIKNQDNCLVLFNCEEPIAILNEDLNIKTIL